MGNQEVACIGCISCIYFNYMDKSLHAGFKNINEDGENSTHVVKKQVYLSIPKSKVFCLSLRNVVHGNT